MSEIEKTLENARLNENELEDVPGGLFNPADKQYIAVVCGGCRKHFVITSDTKEYICTCGYKNTFSG